MKQRKHPASAKQSPGQAAQPQTNGLWSGEVWDEARNETVLALLRTEQPISLMTHDALVEQVLSRARHNINAIRALAQLGAEMIVKILWDDTEGWDGTRTIRDLRGGDYGE
jgi:hypothetical protein